MSESAGPEDTRLHVDSTTMGQHTGLRTQTGQQQELQERFARPFLPAHEDWKRRRLQYHMELLLEVVFGFLSTGHRPVFPMTPPPQFLYRIPARTLNELKIVNLCFDLLSLCIFLQPYSSMFPLLVTVCDYHCDFFLSSAPLLSLLSPLLTAVFCRPSAFQGDMRDNGALLSFWKDHHV